MTGYFLQRHRRIFDDSSGIQFDLLAAGPGRGGREFVIYLDAYLYL